MIDCQFDSQKICIFDNNEVSPPPPNLVYIGCAAFLFLLMILLTVWLAIARTNERDAVREQTLNMVNE